MEIILIVSFMLSGVLLLPVAFLTTSSHKYNRSYKVMGYWLYLVAFILILFNKNGYEVLLRCQLEDIEMLFIILLFASINLYAIGCLLDFFHITRRYKTLSGERLSNSSIITFDDIKKDNQILLTSIGLRSKKEYDKDDKIVYRTVLEKGSFTKDYCQTFWKQVQLLGGNINIHFQNGVIINISEKMQEVQIYPFEVHKIEALEDSDLLATCINDVKW